MKYWSQKQTQLFKKCVYNLAGLDIIQILEIQPLIEATIRSGTLVLTDEYTIYKRLPEWGFEHQTVCHNAGEYARDEIW